MAGGSAQALDLGPAPGAGGQVLLEPCAFGVVDGVQNATVEIAHTAPYYFIGKDDTFALGTCIPFGLNARQMTAWMMEGNGLKLMREFYARYKIVNFPGGNTGSQMGGWYRKEIKTLKDMDGLKMRISGLAGRVVQRLGVVPQQIGGGDIYPALEKGTIDAAEWVGPYDDEKLGLQKVAKFYYYPGWWEPGTSFEVQINLNEWKKLPPEYQEVIKTAAFEANMTMLARFDTRNNDALQRLRQSGTELRPYSNEILTAAEKASFELFDEFAAKDADFKSVFEEWKKFRDRAYSWSNLNQGSFERYVYSKVSS